MAGAYEKDIERLQRLYEEVSSDEEPIVGGEIDPEFEQEDDILEESPHSTDTEQSAGLGNDSDRCSISDDSPVESDIPILDRLNSFLGKDRVTKWQKREPNRAVRSKSQNIINFIPGVTNLARHAITVLEAWLLFFPQNVIDGIVHCTNIYISQCRERYSRERDARDTTSTEIKALIGLLYLAGVLRSSHLIVDDLWANDCAGVEFFRNVMSLKRFQFLLRCLRFDDVTTRIERKKEDKFAPIRAVFDGFVSRCQQFYVMGVCVTIDEMLESFRGRCAFRQYIKNKPAKYGIKIFSMVDANTYYTFNMETYVGTQPNGPYQADNSASEVVKRLVRPILGSGRNLTTDNWFTSVPLAKYLYKEKITIVGTIRKNKREIPLDFISVKNRGQYSSLFGFSKEGTLVSYVPKKGKVVLLLSTMHNDSAIDQDTGEKKKPSIITFYNKTKGGVDKVDEMKARYSVSRKSARWPLTVFFTLLNIGELSTCV